MKNNRKEFRDTKIGIFLNEKAPELLGAIAAVLPEKGGLAIVKNLIEGSSMSPEDKRAADILAHEQFMEYQAEISERWKADMTSDSWLSKNVRPLTLISLFICIVALTILDSTKTFEVAIHWVDLYKALALTVFGGYFVVRGAEKVSKIYRA